MVSQGFPGGSVVKNPPANAEEAGSIWLRKIPWSRKWQPTPVFLPEKSYGQRNLVDCSLGTHRVRRDWARMHTQGATLEEAPSEKFQFLCFSVLHLKE